MSGTVSPLFQSQKNCWYCAYGLSTKRKENEKAECNSPIIPKHLWYRIYISHLLPDYCKCFIKLVFPSNQSTLKEISPEYSLEGLMLKLKVQNFGHLMWRTDSLEKALMLGKTEGRRGWQRMKCLDGITNSIDTSLSKLRDWETGKPGVLQSMGLQRVRHSWATELNWVFPLPFLFSSNQRPHSKQNELLKKWIISCHYCLKACPFNVYLIQNC